MVDQGTWGKLTLLFQIKSGWFYYQVVFMITLLACVYKKVIYITFWSAGKWW